MDTQIFRLKQQVRVYSVFLTSRLCGVIWKLLETYCMFIFCVCIFYGQIVVSFLLFCVNEIEEKAIFLFDSNCNTVEFGMIKK